MNIITYRYSTLARQLFIVTCLLYFIMRTVIIYEIIFFKIDGYYENLNIPLTLLLYIIIIGIIVTFFFSYKICYAIYDNQKLVYYNKLLRKEKTVRFEHVKTIIMDTFGVSFYDNTVTEDNASKNEALFFLPFFRGGIIDAVHIDAFFRKMKADENLTVIKKFKILPGYSKKWKLLSLLYAFLAISVLFNYTTPLYVIILLFQNH